MKRANLPLPPGERSESDWGEVSERSEGGGGIAPTNVEGSVLGTRNQKPITNH